MFYKESKSCIIRIRKEIDVFMQTDVSQSFVRDLWVKFITTCLEI